MRSRISIGFQAIVSASDQIWQFHSKPGRLDFPLVCVRSAYITSGVSKLLIFDTFALQG